MYLIASTVIPLLKEFSSNLKIIIALGPVISMLITLTSSSVMRYLIAAGLFLAINPEFRVRVSLLEFLTAKHMKQVALAIGVLVVCCPGQLRASPSYQQKGRRVSFVVSLQSKLETFVCVVLLLSRNGKVLTVTYLYVLSRFSS